ncbi:MAG TPA: hypothetical protein VML75_06670 [Kofleriaceae bacterium]|nr:hypothetical protein [Kofleriaceae bacterium]
MPRAAIIALLIVGACGRRDPQPAGMPEAAPMASAQSAPADAAPAAAPVVIADAAPPPDCDRLRLGLAGLVGRAMHAANGAPFLERAIVAWRETPAPCRDASWHLAAANLLRWGAHDLQADGGVAFAAASDALTAGLHADRGDRDLFVLIAFMSALGGEPELPADACTAVAAAPPVLGPPYESADRAAYVCGHAALRAGDHAAAIEHFGSIEMATRYADLPLRQAQAHACTGKTSAARRFARTAAKLEHLRAEIFGAIPREHDLLVSEAKTRDLRAGRCPP